MEKQSGSGSLWRVLLWSFSHLPAPWGHRCLIWVYSGWLWFYALQHYLVTDMCGFTVTCLAVSSAAFLLVFIFLLFSKSFTQTHKFFIVVKYVYYKPYCLIHV